MIAAQISEFWYGLVLFLMLMGFGIYVMARGQKALTNQIISRFEAIRLQLDGRLSQLMEVSEKLARAQGVVAGRAEHEAEQKAEQKAEQH